MRVVRWEDNDNGSRGLHVSLQNVTFSCPTNSSSYNETLPTLSPLEVDSAQNGYELPQWLQYQQPPLACAVSLVATWPELFYESQSQQLTASRVLIVTTRNITVPLNFNKKANGTILVYRDVQVGGGLGMWAGAGHGAGWYWPERVGVAGVWAWTQGLATTAGTAAASVGFDIVVGGLLGAVGVDDLGANPDTQF